MTKRIQLALVALTISAFSCAGTVPKAIKARYSSLETAMRQVDFKTFSSYFSSDFTTVDPQGKSSSREEFLNQVRPMFENAKSATAKEKFTDCKIHDGVVDVSFDFTLKLSGKAAKSGKTIVHEVGVDTWKQVDGQWVMVKTVDSKFDVTTGKKSKG